MSSTNPSIPAASQQGFVNPQHGTFLPQARASVMSTMMSPMMSPTMSTMTGGGSVVATNIMEPFYASQSTIGGTIEALAGNQNKYQFVTGAKLGHRTAELRQAKSFLSANLVPAQAMIATRKMELEHMEQQYNKMALATGTLYDV